MILKSKKIETNGTDNPLYDYLISLFRDIKLIQGNTALNNTLRHHSKVTLYLISKQMDLLNGFESTYFNDDGTLNDVAVIALYERSLQSE